MKTEKLTQVVMNALEIGVKVVFIGTEDEEADSVQAIPVGTVMTKSQEPIIEHADHEENQFAIFTYELKDGTLMSMPMLSSEIEYIVSL